MNISRIFSFFVFIGVFLIVIGGAIFLFHHGEEVPDYHAFKGEPKELRSLISVFLFAVSGHSAGVIQLGLLTLMGVPVVRMGWLTTLYFREGDLLYGRLSVFILLVLIASFCLVS